MIAESVNQNHFDSLLFGSRLARSKADAAGFLYRDDFEKHQHDKFIGRAIDNNYGEIA
jgi:hypothetical protein